MIAKIKTLNGFVYDTVVFAIMGKGTKCSIIGFDEHMETLTVIPCYRPSAPHRSLLQLAFIEASHDGWIKDGDVEGYDWIVGDKKRFEHIRLGRLLHPDFIARCKSMQDALNLPEWAEVVDDKTMKDMICATSGFHDSLIRKIESEGDFTTISIEVWGGSIAHIKLENAELSTDCVVGLGDNWEIADTSVFTQNGRIYWANARDIHNTDQFWEELCYFSGTRMLWKIELD